MMMPSKEVTYHTVKPGATVFLVGDIGGTNSNFGVFSTDDPVKLLFSIHYKSQEIADFAAFMPAVLAYLQTQYNLHVHAICFAVAGVVHGIASKLTNLPFVIDAQQIKEVTGVQHVLIANDFEVIVYGLKNIDPKHIVAVLPGSEVAHATQAIIGAGTGLGKSILFYSDIKKRYVSLPSEGGHADFAPQSELELALVQFIKMLKGDQKPVSWEDVVSGRGIQRIFAFFKNKNNGGTLDPRELLKQIHPDEIFNARERDQDCWQTYQLYARLYGRCAKNFALETLARGGIYIAGGIAAKNMGLFEQREFIDEFLCNDVHQELLRRIPVRVITDYNVSLYGAAEFLRVYCTECSIRNLDE